MLSRREFRVGTLLDLVRDPNNHDGRDAVAVCYQREDAQTGEYESFHLGYIPRDENRLIAQMLNMGWGEIFECRIAMLRPEEHYERQVRLIIRILRNPVAQ
ncbi:MAG: HIRAN domain-containing protein [Porphyromonas sp.]|nr:HIRAN domain-containing protein [Porphyromonas sp.]